MDSNSTFLYGSHVHANDIRQHYLRYGGRGTPLLIVPGITSPAITWGFVAERFGESFDTYVLDVRGRGLSSARPDIDYGLDSCAADIAAFTRTMGLTEYVLLGHSMGGRIAIRAAGQHGLKGLQRLVVVDPPVTGPNRRDYPTPLSWYIDSIRLAQQGVTAEQLRQFLPTWSDAQLLLRAEWLPTCDERAIEVGYRGFHGDNIHKDLPFIKVPTLLVAAGQGNVILPEELDELTRLMPALQTARVEAAGHMIPWDDFEGFFRAIEGFLAAATLGGA